MLIQGDCLQEMKNIETDKIDLLFCDLPWSATSCKWDCALDLPLFWKEVNRVCKINCPMFFCCNAKFGNTLISSNPKNFRYDLVWIKSSPVGFLNAKKMPMKKHELIYVFYRKLPFYDLTSHKHKFLDKVTEDLDEKYKNKGGLYGKISRNGLKKNETHYDPALPTSIIKDDNEYCKYDINKNCYGGGKENRIKISKNKEDHSIKYDPPLPTSIIKDDLFIRGKENNTENKDVYNYNERLKNGKLYHHSRKLQKGDDPIYDPPLPTSIIEGVKRTCIYGDFIDFQPPERKNGESRYDPPLPNSILEIKSEKGKHPTQKPIKLIEWILKYYSKEGDTVLDPTMGSGSSGVACLNMNREFIGIEMDEDIFKVANNRLNVPLVE